ncbi:MAG TPA: DUF5134 domain-containing protein [Acidimicrobiales bacterium]|nr:DUF5134 domain-containing protein [Acidimicrobiales bacterium]
MGVPSWLYYLFGVLMFAVATYCFTLLVTSGPAHRTAGRDVEISHVAMGLAMAGMYVPAWAFGPSWLWELAFMALLAWFVVKAVQSIQRYGLHVPHTAIHAVMSFAMLLMYWFPMGSSVRGLSMTMSAGGARMDPALAFVVAFILFGSAIFTVASPNKGATHYGTHDGAHGGGHVGGGPVPVPGRDGHGPEPGAAAIEVDTVIGAPSLVDATHVGMCVAMGLMLILMI